MFDGTKTRIEVRLVTSDAPYSIARAVGLIEGLRQGKVLSITARSVTIPVSAMDGPELVSLYQADDRFCVTHYASREVLAFCNDDTGQAKSPRVTIVG